MIRRRITQCFGRGSAGVRLDPGNGNVMMGTDLLKKTTDVLNENLIAARLDGVVPEEAHAILTVGDQVEVAANRLGRDPVRDTNPLEGKIKRADFTGVVVRKECPADPIRLRPVSNLGTPERDRGGSGGASQVHSQPSIVPFLTLLKGTCVASPVEEFLT